MAFRVLQYSATIPPNTPKANLSVTNFPLINWDIEQIDLDVPAGTAGLMGFYLARSGEQFIPQSPGQFLVWDDIDKEWPVTDQPTGGGWQIVGYNLSSVYPHTVIVRFHVNPLAVPSPGLPAISIINPAGDMSPITL